MIVVPDSHIHIPLIIGNDVLEHITLQVNTNGFEVLSKIEDKYIEEINTDFREKHIEPKKTILNQIQWSHGDVNRSRNQIQTRRRTVSTKISTIETKFNEKTEELKIANETISQLNKLNVELRAQTAKLTAKLTETKLKSTCVRYEDEIEGLNKIITSLKSELHTQNDSKKEEKARILNGKRKDTFEYRVGDLVAIRRTQFGASKIAPPFFGPYKIIKSKGKERYDVSRVGNHPGPLETSSSADLMKPYHLQEDDEVETEDESHRGENDSVGEIEATSENNDDQDDKGDQDELEDDEEGPVAQVVLLRRSQRVRNQIS